ncbi:hypothetical protein [Nocardioides aurantiacus]|uniref:hypothetical protein n=1 Tax=Nocardioides aurantiacus TaxID=86796 RepID=UPI0011CE77D8|nr:hypothetical protein [Nocardioides aurantiacus]
MPEPISTAVALIVAGGGVYGTHQFTRARGSNDDQRLLKREAATALGEALTRLAQDLERAGDADAAVPLHQRRLSETLTTWGQTWDRHSRRLPDEAQHIRRSLRFALGTRFGLAGISDVNETGVDYPLEEHDVIWHQHAVEYVAYIRDWLAEWHDHPAAMERANKVPLKFDPWLHVKARRDYDVRHGLISRLDLFLHRFTGTQEQRP